MFLAPAPLMGEMLTLVWDPNPEPDVAGYVLRYGTKSGSYQWTTNVGSQTLCTVSQLVPEQDYYFTVAAYNFAGFEGERSVEFHYMAMLPPRPPGDPPTPPPPGRVFVLTVEASGGLAVPVTIQPPDQDELASGWIPLVRRYREQTLVTLTAPQLFGGKTFIGWSANEVAIEPRPTLQLHMDGDLTLRAHYVENALVGRWKFDEREGDQARDTSGNGLHAQLEQQTSWAPGVHHGGSLLFDGQDDYLSLPSDSRLDFSVPEFTLALWVLSESQERQVLVEKRHDLVTGMFLLALNRHPGVAGAVSLYAGNRWIDSASRAITDGQWHHLAIVQDAQGFRFYVDGRLDSSDSTRAAYEPSAHGIMVGRSSILTGGWPLAGQIDEVRLYHRVLSLPEIIDLINSQAQSLFRLHAHHWRSHGLIQLLVYPQDGDPLTLPQLGRLDVLTSEELDRPAEQWERLNVPWQWGDGLGWCFDQEGMRRPSRFYMLRERP